MESEKILLKDIIFSKGMIEQLQKYNVNISRLYYEDYMNDGKGIIGSFSDENFDTHIEIVRKMKEIPHIMVTPEFRGFVNGSPNFLYRIVDGRHRVTAAVILGKRKIYAHFTYSILNVAYDKYKQGEPELLMWMNSNYDVKQDILNLAVDKSDTEMCIRILEEGADPNFVKEDGTTLVFDILLFDIDKHMVEIFRRFNVNFNHRDKNGNNVLMKKVSIMEELNYLDQETRNEQLENLRFILTFVDVNSVKENGDTCLHIICKRFGYNDYIALKLFVENGMEPGIRNNKGKLASDYLINKKANFKEESLDILNNPNKYKKSGFWSYLGY